jgi:PST family polysaccharide transporter
MGYIVVAKGRGGVFFWCELACAAVYGMLSWICVRNFGLKGAGIAFLGYCIVHGFIYYPITRRIGGFHWTRENLRGGLLYLGGIAVVFYSFYVLPSLLALGVGTTCTIIFSALSVRTMSRMVSWERLPAPLRKMLLLLGCSPVQPHG